MRLIRRGATAVHASLLPHLRLSRLQHCRNSDNPNCAESSGWEKLFSERLYLAYGRALAFDRSRESLRAGHVGSVGSGQAPSRAPIRFGRPRFSKQHFQSERFSHALSIPLRSLRYVRKRELLLIDWPCPLEPAGPRARLA